MPSPMSRYLFVFALVSLALGASSRAEAALKWETHAQSPRSAPRGAMANAALYSICGSRDLGLLHVAKQIASRRAAAKGPYTHAQLAELLRAAGVPQPWPRAWSLAGHHDEATIAKRLRRWSANHARRGQRRCGVVRGADANGTPILAVVTVDALADMAPLPIRAQPSQWLSLDATMHAPVSSVSVLLLGPRGRSRRVLASLSGRRLRSRFRVATSGRWLIQVLATLPDGPLPVLETPIFSSIAPPTTLPTAPGAYRKALGEQQVDEVLLRLLNKPRQSEGLPKLRRDVQLDKVALAHAKAMLAAKRVAHDLGSGTPRQRVSAAGLSTLLVGENVASAPTPARIHHALYGSPSHRDNMLQAAFQRVGIAALRDKRQQLWVVELFAR